MPSWLSALPWLCIVAGQIRAGLGGSNAHKIGAFGFRIALD